MDVTSELRILWDWLIAARAENTEQEIAMADARRHFVAMQAAINRFDLFRHFEDIEDET